MIINRNFTFLFFSTLISGVGTGLTALSVAWVIQQVYKDFNALAFLNTIGLICAFIMLPKFSLWVDEYSKINLARGMFFIGFIVQSAFFIINKMIGVKLWVLVAIGVISSLLNTLEPVNRIAIAKAITKKSQYASTTRLLEVMQQLMTFIAGFIGILLLRDSQVSPILILDALSFLIAFLLINGIKIEKIKDEKSDIAHKSAIIYPLNEVPKIDKIFYLFGAITIFPYACIMAQRVIYPGHFETLLHATPVQYSLYTLPYALGAILAISTIQLINKQIDKYLSIFIGISLYALAVIFLLMRPTLCMTYLAFFLFSICHCTIRINRLELMMHLVPIEYFGRVNGIFQSFTTIMIIILSWLPALVMKRYGITAGWMIFTMVSVFPVGIYFCYLKRIKALSFSSISYKEALTST